jgi:hypothetical protein
MVEIGPAAVFVGGFSAPPLDDDLLGPVYARQELLARYGPLRVDERPQTLELARAVDLFLHGEGRRPLARGVGVHEGLVEAEAPDRLKRELVVLFGLAGKTDDEIGRNGMVGERSVKVFDDRGVARQRVFSVHEREHPVGAALQRQMDRARDGVVVGDDAHDVVVEIHGVRGEEVHAQKAPHLRHPREQAVEGDIAAVHAVLVDVLPQEGYLGRASLDAALDVAHDGVRGEGNEPAPDVGHDAVRAVVFAAVRDGDPFVKGELVAPAGRGRVDPRGEVPAVLREKGARLALARVPGEELAQARRLVRAHHKVGRAVGKERFAEALRHAAGYDEERPAVVAGRAHAGQGAFLRVASDRAGVEDDNVGRVLVRSAPVAGCFERVGHEVGIALVHLAAEGLYEIAFAHQLITPFFLNSSISSGE